MACNAELRPVEKEACGFVIGPEGAVEILRLRARDCFAWSDYPPRN